jgi:hypothetical protein
MYLPRLTNGQRTSITTLIRVGFSTQTVCRVSRQAESTQDVFVDGLAMYNSYGYQCRSNTRKCNAQSGYYCSGHQVGWSAGHSGSFTWATRPGGFTIDKSRCSSAIVRINSLRLAGVMAVPSRKNKSRRRMEIDSTPRHKASSGKLAR